MPHTPRPVISPEELAVVVEFQADVVAHFGSLDFAASAGDSAVVVYEWLAMLHQQVTRRAESQVRGQLRML
jgi:hypothetical protein